MEKILWYNGQDFPNRLSMLYERHCNLKKTARMALTFIQIGNNAGEAYLGGGK